MNKRLSYKLKGTCFWCVKPTITTVTSDDALSLRQAQPRKLTQVIADTTLAQLARILNSGLFSWSLQPTERFATSSAVATPASKGTPELGAIQLQFYLVWDVTTPVLSPYATIIDGQHRRLAQLVRASEERLESSHQTTTSWYEDRWHQSGRSRTGQGTRLCASLEQPPTTN